MNYVNPIISIMFISEQLGKLPQDESHFNFILVNYCFDYFIKIKIISNTQYELPISYAH